MANSSNSSGSLSTRVTRLEGAIESIATAVKDMQKQWEDDRRADREERRRTESLLFQKIDEIKSRPFPSATVIGILSLVLALGGSIVAYAFSNISSNATRVEQNSQSADDRLTALAHKNNDDIRVLSDRITEAAGSLVERRSAVDQRLIALEDRVDGVQENLRREMTLVNDGCTERFAAVQQTIVTLRDDLRTVVERFHSIIGKEVVVR